MALDRVVDSAALDADLTAIADAIRGKTGGADTLAFPDGMISAIAGISGESGGGALNAYMTKVTPEEDVQSIVVTHNLGTTDILLAACWAETLGDVTPSVSNATLGKMWSNTDIVNNRGGFGFCAQYYWNLTNAYAATGSPNASGYWDKITDENTFEFVRGQSGTATFLAGVTYTVIIVAANGEG